MEQIFGESGDSRRDHRDVMQPSTARGWDHFSRAVRSDAGAAEKQGRQVAGKRGQHPSQAVIGYGCNAGT